MAGKFSHAIKRFANKSGKPIAGLLVVVTMAVGIGNSARSATADMADPRQAMMGMTESQVRACMGPPRSVSAGTDGELWAYRSANRAKSAGLCEVNLIFHHNAIGKVTFRGDTGSVVTKYGACGFLVRSCIK